MKNFMIVRLANLKFQCIVLATSYENPLENLEEIEIDLKKQCYEGPIIFDMLACLGDNNNRFFIMLFRWS
ncbi:type II toxin-antitoxin system RnlB family antitoxin [Exiguobacterium chiriqhucha]|uniref:type II toxin-antitoxin system RnlB family antitoxin n=1 Tax=Exiguobacterium chiriqhucha TaxID=1385984 RepID=UPI00073724AB|nr:type II toxin-antitoxin system RnlB family antitoxin [Exiguobacterium chiriqhucha]